MILELLVSVSLGARPDAGTMEPRRIDLQATEDTGATGRLDPTFVDAGTVTFTLKKAPARGTATVGADGAFSYVPRADVTGDDTFLVEARAGKLAEPFRVAVRVKPVNDAPVTKPLSLSVSEDSSVKGRLSASDVDKDSLSFKLASPP
ncbi:MAG: hypothetical protein INH41_03020, partial [Myxococcaceae bacterium]|nr:hypothetical protein [Myxococcaceae bacterium]